MSDAPQLFHVGRFGVLPVYFFRMPGPDWPWLDLEWLFAMLDTDEDGRRETHQALREEFPGRVAFYGDADAQVALVHPLALVQVLHYLVEIGTLNSFAIIELFRAVVEAQTKLAAALCDADGAAYLTTAMERATADEATRRLH